MVILTQTKHLSTTDQPGEGRSGNPSSGTCVLRQVEQSPAPAGEPAGSTVRRYNVAGLNELSREGFLRVIGPVFEHSPWIAELTWAKRPFESAATLHRALCFADAGRAYQDEIFGAPDEVQCAELPDDPGFNARLAVERESGQRPFFGHARMLDPALDAALDLVLVLRAKQDNE